VKAKILIVGGGASGTSLALHAASRTDPLREPVVLIEKGRLGSGSSGRSGAIVHQAYSDRVLAGMARDAVKSYASMRANTGRVVGYRQTGVLVLADTTDADHLARFHEDAEMQRSIGIDARIVEAEEMRGIVPGLEVDDDAIGCFQPDGGFIDPERTINTFAKLARSAGAVTRTGVSDPRVLIEGGRAVGVQTDSGTFHAPNVVLATGAWTPRILESLGVTWPLRVMRTEEVFFEMPKVELPEEEDDGMGHEGGFETRFVPDPLETMPVAHPCVIDTRAGFHARCEPLQARTRVGRLGFDQLDEVTDPDQMSADVSGDFHDWARNALAGRLPVYRDMEGLGDSTATVTLTPDGLPIIGPVEEIPGLWVVTGFSGNDFHLAPSIGEGLAQMILGQPVSAFDPAFFSPERFQHA
jgi:glycine/D-amino acid oxidase-like deaminating enzyme